MAVLFTNDRWLFALILVLFLDLSSANHYERKNGKVFFWRYLYAYLSSKYSFLNTDAISCSLIHPCPPGYYCSIVLGETGGCHVEDKSISQVFSGEKENTDDNVKREENEEAYMEEEENDNSYELVEYADEDQDDEKYYQRKRSSPRGSKS